MSTAVGHLCRSSVRAGLWETCVTGAGSFVVKVLWVGHSYLQGTLATISQYKNTMINRMILREQHRQQVNRPDI